MMKYEYLLIKKNKEGLVYEKTFFYKSVDARKCFRKGDILLKCKYKSIFYGGNFDGWSVNEEDVVKRYEK